MWDEQSDDDKSFILDQSRITQYENDGLNDSEEDLQEEQKNYEYDNNNILSQIQNDHNQQNNQNHQSYNQNNQDYQTPGGQEAPQQGHIIINNFNQNVNQQQNKVVNVGDLISMDEKINEYKNESIRKKLEEIKMFYPCFRKIRGDGNCFFRAFAFAYFDQVTMDRNQNRFNQLLKNKSQQSMLQQQMNQVCGYDFYIVSFIKLQSYQYFKSKEQDYQVFMTEQEVEQIENIYLQWGTEAEEKNHQ
ncbi:hypothetical protein PPERSA_11478 [Pseudocohnilembus persalinus]|uniref:OTU domain-containing protein n=1 Tax=Pseudocohnilembus persalinus TaxID=266149 RepID=A0A0V0QXF3_PSEPJ|nr:hypothetical protein PPERSA_11478 [Pseudocohnilembus persalinus]|eukprot:KRX06833.1 hypothetical protein PPERSA_11478 [Pseudocohnilembus persalinus]